MTLTIDLPDDQVAALKAKAQAQGVSAEQYARTVLEQDLKSGRRRHISRSDPREHARRAAGNSGKTAQGRGQPA